jgi:photosynthetic reaction center H subunit
MGTGAITQYVDVAQIVLYMFWAFFFSLIFYLQRESKREGYPMHTDRPGRSYVDGLLPMPSVKTYLLPHGGEAQAPHDRDMIPAKLAATPTAPFPGAPLEPTGNPMLDNIGPGSYTLRSDTPELTFDGQQSMVPMRNLPELSVARQDADPRGMPVVGCDGEVGATVRDIWIDRLENTVRFLELEVADSGLGNRVLVPMIFTRIRNGKVHVNSVLGRHFAGVPRLRNPEQVTSLEEERIMAYYGAGTLYATPERQEPLL